MNYRYFYSIWKIIKREPLYSNLKFVSFLLFPGKCINSTCTDIVMPYLKTPVPKGRGCGSTVHTACGWKTWAPALTSGLHTVDCSVFPSEQLLVPSSLQPLLPWGKQWMPRGSTDVLNMFGTREKRVLLFPVREFRSRLYSEIKHLHPDAAHSFHVENMAYSRIHLA